MSILSVDTIQPIGSGSTVTLNAAKIVVGTGITFESNGQAIYAGIITATSFSGSGANLTSIPAGQLTGTVADARISTLTSSKLSGALPAISGANLTSLPEQATIANNADNRIITGGSGVNLNGEANLTFDSSNRFTIGSANPMSATDYGTAKINGSAGGVVAFSVGDTQKWEVYGNAAQLQIYDRANTKYNTKFKAGGNVEITDGNLVLASGHGIDFSATGNVSGTQSELLDDYEEGTWTPEINGGYSSISYHNPRIGYYTKVGNHVSFTIYLYVYQATGAAANVQITLPFTSVSNSGRETGAYTVYSNGFMSNSWNEKSGCGYLIGSNYSYLRPCKLTNGAIIYGNDTRLGTGANNQYLIICGQMFAA